MVQTSITITYLGFQIIKLYRHVYIYNLIKQPQDIIKLINPFQILIGKDELLCLVVEMSFN